MDRIKWNVMIDGDSKEIVEEILNETVTIQKLIERCEKLEHRVGELEKQLDK